VLGAATTAGTEFKVGELMDHTGAFTSVSVEARLLSPRTVVCLRLLAQEADASDVRLFTLAFS
jgi:hypothetical protein